MNTIDTETTTKHQSICHNNNSNNNNDDDNNNDTTDNQISSRFSSGCCLGTNNVVIEAKNNVSSAASSLPHDDTTRLSTIEGVIALYNHVSQTTRSHQKDVVSNNNNGGGYDVEIMLTDGSMTFYGRIESSTMTTTKLKKITTALLTTNTNDSNKTISVTYTKRNAPTLTHPQVVDIRIRETLSLSTTNDDDDTIRRTIWKSHLQPSSSSPLPFIHKITHSLHHSLLDTTNYRQQNNELTNKLKEWKHTATCLKDEISHRERELLNNFVLLLNEQKRNYSLLRLELERERRKKVTTATTTTRSSQSLSSDNIVPREQSCIIDHIEDHDAEIFNREDVEKYATGRPVRNNNGRTNRDVVVISQSSQTAQQDDDDVEEESCSFERTNPLTGVVEMWNVENDSSSATEDDGDSGINDNERRQRDEGDASLKVPQLHHSQNNSKETRNNSVSSQGRPLASEERRPLATPTRMVSTGGDDTDSIINRQKQSKKRRQQQPTVKPPSSSKNNLTKKRPSPRRRRLLPLPRFCNTNEREEDRGYSKMNRLSGGGGSSHHQSSFEGKAVAKCSKEESGGSDGGYQSAELF